MITTEAPNSNPMPSNYLATKAQAAVVIPARAPDSQIDFCSCKYPAICDYTELAFADLTDTGNTFRNDKSSFISRVELASDSVIFQIVDALTSTVVATITDQTLGVWTDVGGFPTQPLQAGFIVDWTKVLQILGAGFYRIRVSAVIIGKPIEEDSRKFWLRKFDQDLANKTIKIETVQNGNIESSIIDYTGMNWDQSFRIKGKFFDPQDELIIDKYLDETRSLEQVQDQVKTVYTLETGLIPSEIGKALTRDNLLANRTFITDYNLFNYERYERLALYVEEIIDQKYFEKQTQALFTITFTDKKQNILKRN